MERSPKIFIVTPSFNQGQYLEQAITSVLGQSYPDLEYLVIDGGSQDGSAAIAQKYASRLAYWTSEPDKGQAQAINKGLRRATGEIIGWLNSDDRLLPGALQRITRAFAEDKQADFIYGDTQLIDPHGRVLITIRAVPFRRNILLYGGNLCAQPACFFRRRVLERVGPLDEDLHWSMDYEYWLRALKAGCIFRPLAAPLAQFRIHPESKSVSKQAAMAGEHFESYWRHFGNPGIAPTGLDRLVYRLRKNFYRGLRLLLLFTYRGSFRPFQFTRSVRRLKAS